VFPQKLSEKSPFELFCEQETIQYCIKQFRSSKFKNLKPQEKSEGKSDIKVRKTQREEIMKKIHYMHSTEGKSFKQIKDELVIMQVDGVIPDMGYETKDPIYFSNLWNRWKKKNNMAVDG